MTYKIAGVLALAWACLTLVGRLAAEDVVAPDMAAKVVDVSEMNVAPDGAVCGSVVNRSDHPVRDIHMVIRHQWLWNDERHPGKNYPGTSERVTIAEELAPGAQADFNDCAAKPFARRSDGRFKTTVEVIGYSEVGGEAPVAASSMSTLPAFESATYSLPPTTASAPTT